MPHPIGNKKNSKKVVPNSTIFRIIIAKGEFIMKKFLISSFFLISILLVGLGCKKNESKNDNGLKGLALLALISDTGDNDPVGSTIIQGIDSSTEAMESATSEGSSTAFLNTPVPPLEKLRFYWNSILDLQLPSTGLHAATFTLNYNCLGGGSITRIINASSTPFTGIGPTSFTGSRTFNDCTLAPMGRFKWNGGREVSWNNLAISAPYIQNLTTLDVAVNRTLTDKIRGFIIEVKGNGSVITGGSNKISSQVNFSANNAYSVVLNLSRVAKSARGRTLFDHTIVTPTSLNHSVSGTGSSRQRTVNGSIKVTHNIAQFETLTTMNNVVWGADCKPVSGNATVVVSGSRTATGTVSFSGGKATYTYTGTNSSGSGEIDFIGCNSDI